MLTTRRFANDRGDMKSSSIGGRTGRQAAAAKGAYYKRRTKRWLERQGFVVGFLERVHVVKRQGRLIAIKRDQFGADLLAINGWQVVFVQAKLGSKSVAAAKREFNKYEFPPHVKTWIVTWARRARVPRVYVVERLI